MVRPQELCRSMDFTNLHPSQINRFLLIQQESKTCCPVWDDLLRTLGPPQSILIDYHADHSQFLVLPATSPLIFFFLTSQILLILLLDLQLSESKIC